MTTPSTLHPKERGSVRANDPITSQCATTSQDFVLMVLRDFTRPGPFTLANVVANTAGVLSPSRARTAVRELQDKGLIEETGDYTLTTSGRRARLLTLTDTGRAAA